jgi:hypothetical protein
MSRSVAKAFAAIVGLATLAVLIRLPLFGVPLDPDEGGYAYVAHRWAQGANPYRDPWVDRPQGLLIVFRAVTDVSYSVTAIRVAALVTGVILTLAVAACAAAIGGQRAAVIAGVMAAVVGAGSFVEGYELNGELIGSAIGTCGVALALWWAEGLLAPWALVAAGACGGFAPLVKQPLVEALVATVCVVLATKQWRQVRFVVAGAVLPLAAAAASGVQLGWHGWWFAVWRFQWALSSNLGVVDHLRDVWRGLHLVAFDLVGLAVAAAIALVATVKAPGRWPLAVWLLVALAGAASGPFQHQHYWIPVVAPMAVIAGTATASIDGHRARVLEGSLLVLAVALPVARVVRLSVDSPSQRAARVVPSDNEQRVAESDIARWVRQHVPKADSSYAFVAAADFYLRTQRQTSFPYLWYEQVTNVPGASARLRLWLAGPDAPDWLIEYQSAQPLDGSGRLATILLRRYHVVAEVDGYPILRRNS